MLRIGFGKRLMLLLAVVGLGLVVGGALHADATAAPAATATWTTYANGDDVWDLAFEGNTIVWAATRGGGVVRWDTSSLTAPTATQYLAPQTGLAGNVVRAVVVDAHNTKWFATNKGLARLTADGTWSTFSQASLGGKLPSNTLTALALQGNSTLWVGGQQVWSPNDHQWRDGGFARLDITTDPPTVLNTFSTASHPDTVPSDNVTAIAIDPTSGDVWLTFRTGLESVAPTPDRPNTYFRARYGGIAVVHPDLSLDKFQHADGDASSWPKYNSLLSVAVDAQGLKWFGTGDLTQGGNGFHILKGNTPATAQWKGFTAPGSSPPAGLTPLPSLPQGANRILHIATGQNNQMWLSLAADSPNLDRGEGLGVCLLSWPGGFDGASTPACALYNTTGGTTGQSLPGNLVRAFLLDPARQVGYFGTGGRLPEVGDVAYSQGTEGHGIGALTFSPPATIVMSTSALGLSPRSNHISAIALKSDHTVWVGAAYPTSAGEWSGSGLSRLGTNGRWSQVALPGNASQAVSSLAVDMYDQVWAGLLRELRPDGSRAAGGVAREGSPWTLIQGGSGFPLWSVSVLATDDTRVWLGTGSAWPAMHATTDLAAGAVSYDAATGRWGGFVSRPPLVGSEVTSISAAGGDVWVANTSALDPGGDAYGGVSRLNGTTWSSARAGQDGLKAAQGDVRAVYAASDGTVWAGGYAPQSGSAPDPSLSNAVINWRGPSSATWNSVSFRDEGWVSAIAQRAGGAVWVGVSRGGQNVEDFPYKVFPAGQGNQYYAQGGLRVNVNGLWMGLTPDTSPLVSGHITALTVDSNNNVWIGTTMGLMKYSGPDPVDTRTPRLWLPLLSKRNG